MRIIGQPLDGLNLKFSFPVEDVAEALKPPLGRYHRFTLEEYRRQVVLLVEELPPAATRIANRYGIDKLINVQ